MTQTLLVALACGLAGHRLWRIGARDSLTANLRLSLERRTWNHPHARRNAWLLTLLTCPWCIGWWITGAAVAWTAWAVELDWRLALLAWPIASSVTGFVAKLDKETS